VGNLPVLKPQEVVRLLAQLGFQEARQRGSHKQFRHGRARAHAIRAQARPADGRATTVPFHQGQDISPILLRKVADDIRVTVEQLLGRESR